MKRKAEDNLPEWTTHTIQALVSRIRVRRFGFWCYLVCLFVCFCSETTFLCNIYDKAVTVMSQKLYTVSENDGTMRGLSGTANLSGDKRLVGQVVKASASRAEDQGFDSRLRRGVFSWVESYQ